VPYVRPGDIADGVLRDIPDTFVVLILVRTVEGDHADRPVAGNLDVAGGRHGLTVAETCRRYQISRQTFYKYRQRSREQGLDGPAPRPRRPFSSRRTISQNVTDSRSPDRFTSRAPAWHRRSRLPMAR
jgi:helix-turn-helix protein